MGHATPPLRHCLSHCFILAYREDTHQLEDTLSELGLSCQVVRQVHQPGYETYSRSYLCLLNHRAAWERVAQGDGLALIVEADFVPVRGMGELPASFDPQDPTLGIAWLYTCAPQVYTVTPQGHGLGYSTAMVAYVITPRSAQVLLEYGDRIAADPGPTAYSPWDSGLAYYLSDRGFQNYVPFRNYGEHGGISNPEHRQHIHRRRRLSGAHRADVLYGPLCFLPAYAQGSPWRYGQGRLYGRFKGVGRLLMGKYLRWPVLRGDSRPWPLAWFALGRQLTWVP